MPNDNGFFRHYVICPQSLTDLTNLKVGDPLAFSRGNLNGQQHSLLEVFTIVFVQSAFIKFRSKQSNKHILFTQQQFCIRVCGKSSFRYTEIKTINSFERIKSVTEEFSTFFKLLRSHNIPILTEFNPSISSESLVLSVSIGIASFA